MVSSAIVRGAVALVCLLLGQSLLGQDTGTPNGAAQGVVYRCVLTSGSVEYTNIPKPGCVVVSTYVYRPKQQETTGNNSTQLIEQGSYVNRDGVVVHSPAHSVSGTAPPGASAQCRDGSYSFSLHHSGTCSHHGGVSQWLK